MADTFWSLFSDLDDELAYIGSLIKGTTGIIETTKDTDAEIDLLDLAKKKVAASREQLQALMEEHRRLEEEKKKDEPQPPA
jgi:hypothetical protein